MVDQSGAPAADDAWLESLQQRIEEAQEQGQSFDLEPFLAERPHQRERVLVLREILEVPVPPREAVMPSGPPIVAGCRVLAVLGSGGMGTVYLAEQRTPIRRRVALKVIKLGMDTRAVLARFEAERQALALMEHPGIAKVYEAGATLDGRPYFAMEYVKGVPITRYCDDNWLSVEQRLALFQQVCSAVQHAHTKGVIHRDLTPNNVLVAAHDGRPTAKIIDFGLARATDHRLTERTLFTEQGVLLGTPEYMSPEQAGLDALDIDMRTDVYTLGVLLYELLTGALPFSREQLRQAGYEAMRAIIRTQEPEKPSTKVTRHAQGSEAVARLRRTDPDRLLRRLRGDLDWVALKCLEKDRTRRYATVSHLAEDVQRHLDHHPVQARAPSIGYRLTKLARRYRGQLAAAAAVLTALVGGLALATYFWLDAAEQAKEAKRLAGVADDERQAAMRQAAIAYERARDAETAKAGEAAKAMQLAQKVHEFDLLAADVYLRKALAAEESFYPPWPGDDGERVRAMRRWLDEDVRRLLLMRPDIDATVQSLRGRAVPATPEEAEHDASTHARYSEWQWLSAKLASLTGAQETRRRPRELAMPQATATEQAMTASELNDLAWPRVDPDESRRIWGEEARALSLAQLAWSKSTGADARTRAAFANTLAWAWFATGNDQEAIAQSKVALALAGQEEKTAYAGHLASLEASVQAVTGEAGEKAIASLRQQIETLGAAVTARRTYRFAEESLRFLHDTLVELQGKLSALEGHHDTVAERLKWAESIDALTVGHSKARVSWATAAEAIREADGIVASTLYEDQPIDLRPQTGLVPIGMNPATLLWEFYELRSAWDGKCDPAAIEIPRHIPDGERKGHIDVGAGTGIVFVLLPGRTFTMGAQRDDPGGPNFDRQADEFTRPHCVPLAPFFLARHELTRGQWKRLAGGADPSGYQLGREHPGNPGAITDVHPVEQVNWVKCEELLRHHGLALPTEAQWEYGCRAGTAWPWWTGDRASTLAGASNVFDRDAAKHHEWAQQEGDFEDGWCLHAPVGTYRANAFGLFDTHGNVWEWCADPFCRYSVAARPGDGLRQVAPVARWVAPASTAEPGLPARSSLGRVARGGAYNSTAGNARSAARAALQPEVSSTTLGVRPARTLQR